MIQNPVDVKSKTYIDSNKDINEKCHKFKNGDTVRISKHKNLFCKNLYFKFVWRSFCH